MTASIPIRFISLNLYFMLVPLTQQTLQAIASSNFRLVSVLEKYGLDYCCGGKQTLEDACRQQQLDSSIIVAELEEVDAIHAGHPFNHMSADTLIEYLLMNHHFYIRQEIPALRQQLKKLIGRHSAQHLFLPALLEALDELEATLIPHLETEETQIFPAIRDLEKQVASFVPIHDSFEWLFGPLLSLEKEHDEAGQQMHRIRSLSHQYTAPDKSCLSFRFCFEALQIFENKLHEHLHLENNILFPMAERLLLSRLEEG